MRRFACIVLFACGSPTTSTPTTTTPTASTPTTEPTTTTTANSADSPQITRSGGVAGGIVILWPRIAAAANDDIAKQLAAKIQVQLRAIAERAHPGKPIDMRPEPERACPRAGCAATALGAAILKHEGGCAVVATVAAGGQSPSTILPWVGAVELRANQSAFREPPEAQIKVLDYANCNDAANQLGGKETAAIEAALK